MKRLTTRNIAQLGYDESEDREELEMARRSSNMSVLRRCYVMTLRANSRPRQCVNRHTLEKREMGMHDSAAGIPTPSPGITGANAAGGAA